MKRASILILAILISFGAGYYLRDSCAGVEQTQGLEPDVEEVAQTIELSTKTGVTGVGGIFFKSSNPKELKDWYRKHLGLETDKYGTNFVWYQGADSTQKGYTQWSPFIESTTYFQPSEKQFMLNYRVGDLVKLVAEFKRDSVVVTDTIELYDYGKFVHIMDPEGNKIELWEPIDTTYAKFGGGLTK